MKLALLGWKWGWGWLCCMQMDEWLDGVSAWLSGLSARTALSIKSDIRIHIHIRIRHSHLALALRPCPHTTCAACGPRAAADHEMQLRVSYNVFKCVRLYIYTYMFFSIYIDFLELLRPWSKLGRGCAHCELVSQFQIPLNDSSWSGQSSACN